MPPTKKRNSFCPMNGAIATDDNKAYIDESPKNTATR